MVQWCIESKKTLSDLVAKPLSWVKTNLKMLKLLRVLLATDWSIFCSHVKHGPSAKSLRFLTSVVLPLSSFHEWLGLSVKTAVNTWASLTGLAASATRALNHHQAKIFAAAWKTLGHVCGWLGVQQGSGSMGSQKICFCCIYRCWQVVTSIHQASTGETLRNARERLPGTTSLPWCQKPPGQSHRCCHHHVKIHRFIIIYKDSDTAT